MKDVLLLHVYKISDININNEHDHIDKSPLLKILGVELELLGVGLRLVVVLVFVLDSVWVGLLGTIYCYYLNFFATNIFVKVASF